MLAVQPLGHLRLFHARVTIRGFVTFMPLSVLWQGERGQTNPGIQL